MLVIVKGHSGTFFLPHPYNYCNSFGDTFWPNHTLIFPKSGATPTEFPFHIVDGKNNSPNLGYGLARPRIFRDLSKEISLIHPLKFFQSMFLDWKNFM